MSFVPISVRTIRHFSAFILLFDNFANISHGSFLIIIFELLTHFKNIKLNLTFSLSFLTMKSIFNIVQQPHQYIQFSLEAERLIEHYLPIYAMFIMFWIQQQPAKYAKHVAITKAFYTYLSFLNIQGLHNHAIIGVSDLVR